MNTNTIILIAAALCGAATAANINAYANENCQSSAYTTCTGIAPDVCCVSLVEFGPEQHGAQSGKFIDLPNPSTILGYTPAPATNDGCGTVFAREQFSGDTLCTTIYPEEGQFTGLAYYLGPPTPSAPTTNERRTVQNHKCSSSVNPDTLTLADGTKYDLTSMSTTMASQLWSFGVQGSTKAQIPNQFAQYTI